MRASGKARRRRPPSSRRRVANLTTQPNLLVILLFCVSSPCMRRQHRTRTYTRGVCFLSNPGVHARTRNRTLTHAHIYALAHEIPHQRRSLPRLPSSCLCLVAMTRTPSFPKVRSFARAAEPSLATWSVAPSVLHRRRTCPCTPPSGQSLVFFPGQTHAPEWLSP
jgi:hypothetical protein